MVKLVYCFRRRPDLDFETFSRYLRDVHGPIAARIPGLRRLVQSQAIPAARALRPPDFDAMVELWFDDLDALVAARETLEYELATADEANFIDALRCAFFVTEEHEVKLPAGEAGAARG